LIKIAKSFGFAVPPNVNLDVHAKPHKIQKRGSRGGFGPGYKNSLDSDKAKFYRPDPTQKQDGRQFTRG